MNQLEKFRQDVKELWKAQLNLEQCYDIIGQINEELFLYYDLTTNEVVPLSHQQAVALYMEIFYRRRRFLIRNNINTNSKNHEIRNVALHNVSDEIITNLLAMQATSHIALEYIAKRSEERGYSRGIANEDVFDEKGRDISRKLLTSENGKDNSHTLNNYFKVKSPYAEKAERRKKG